MRGRRAKIGIVSPASFLSESLMRRDKQTRKMHIPFSPAFAGLPAPRWRRRFWTAFPGQLTTTGLDNLSRGGSWLKWERHKRRFRRLSKRLRA